MKWCAVTGDSNIPNTIDSFYNADTNMLHFCTFLQSSHFKMYVTRLLYVPYYCDCETIFNCFHCSLFRLHRLHRQEITLYVFPCVLRLLQQNLADHHDGCSFGGVTACSMHYLTGHREVQICHAELLLWQVKAGLYLSSFRAHILRPNRSLRLSYKNSHTRCDWLILKQEEK